MNVINLMLMALQPIATVEDASKHVKAVNELFDRSIKMTYKDMCMIRRFLDYLEHYSMTADMHSFMFCSKVMYEYAKSHYECEDMKMQVENEIECEMEEFGY